MRRDEDVAQRLAKSGAFAVMTLANADDAVLLAQALLAGGVSAMELALRTPAAMDALRAVVRAVPDMLVGAGTLLEPEQACEALDAGAAFGMAPGLNPRIVEAAREAGLPFAPGVCTPSDVDRAVELGCRVLKFFPAEPLGGLAYLRSLARPYAHRGVSYVVLGGVNAAKMRLYLRDPNVLAVGGSWLADQDKIARKNWGGITTGAREAAMLVREKRGHA